MHGALKGLLIGATAGAVTIVSHQYVSPKIGDASTSMWTRYAVDLALGAVAGAIVGYAAK